MKDNITFAFQGGRKSRLNSPSESYAKDFFYTYHLFKSSFNNVNIIEFKKCNRKVINFIFSSLRYITTIPFYSEQILNKETKNDLRNTKYLICVNQRVSFSLFPYTIFKSLSGELNITVFIMGLFLDQKRHFVRMFLRKLLINLFCLVNDNIIFLSQEEMNYAKLKFSRFDHKFHFLPFSIDHDFWNSNNNIDKKNNILFVGNDEKRDFEFLKKIPYKLNELNFTILSKFIEDKDFHGLDNVKVINGMWSDEVISDDQLKELYDKSLLSLIPLKDSFQPSGQSVALQSMAMGTPVLITYTKGFWQKEIFEDNKNIFFMKENDLDLWVDKIRDLVNDQKTLKNVAHEAKKIVTENYNLDIFFNNLKNIIFN